jgi:hypothetical protein
MLLRFYSDISIPLFGAGADNSDAARRLFTVAVVSE